MTSNHNKLLKQTFIVFLFICISGGLWAQSSYMPLNDIPYHWLDRFDVLYSNPTGMHLSLKGITRKQIAEMAMAVDSLYPDIPLSDQSDIQWLIDQNNDWVKQENSPDLQLNYLDSSRVFYSYQENDHASLIRPQYSKKPFLKYFYKTPAHLFEVNDRDFTLRINPLLNFRLASNQNDDQLLFENQRGISIRGAIDSKVYFHTDILESQARFPQYVNDFRNKFSAVPGAGFYKTYQSNIFNISNGVDFLLANAYVGTSISRHVQVELGHGRHFLGNGIRSLFLSDFSTDYFYLKLNTRIWRFHYQNIFGEVLQERRARGDMLLPKKYFAAHYLSLNIRSNFQLGFFETVVFARENQFELQYLNPVILYRTVEGAIGSPDNVLLGLDVKYNLWKKLSFYSQFILDEFKVSEIRAKSGWWANKYALQLGLKAFDLFGISHLDAQIEYNVARPYTYSHRTGVAHYSHYRQSLAHPLGANFREGIFRLRYQPNDNWFFILRALTMHIGEDLDTLNYGSNILTPNDDRVQDYNNEILQGVRADIVMIGVDISYQLKHGLFLDLFMQARNKQSELTIRDQQNTYVGAGIRWNLGRRWMEF